MGYFQGLSLHITLENVKFMDIKLFLDARKGKNVTACLQICSFS